jgi:hypothetical protein
MQMLDEEFNEHIIKGLPLEMQPDRLYSTVGGLDSTDRIVRALRLQAKGVGSDDSATRVIPAANMARPLPTIPNPPPERETGGSGVRGGGAQGAQVKNRWENIVCHL